MWSGFIWLSIGPVTDSSEPSNEPSGSIKAQKFPLLASSFSKMNTPWNYVCEWLAFVNLFRISMYHTTYFVCIAWTTDNLECFITEYYTKLVFKNVEIQRQLKWNSIHTSFIYPSLTIFLPILYHFHIFISFHTFPHVPSHPSYISCSSDLLILPCYRIPLFSSHVTYCPFEFLKIIIIPFECNLTQRRTEIKPKLHI